MTSNASRLTSKYLKWGTYLAEPLAPKVVECGGSLPALVLGLSFCASLCIWGSLDKRFLAAEEWQTDGLFMASSSSPQGEAKRTARTFWGVYSYDHEPDEASIRHYSGL